MDGHRSSVPANASSAGLVDGYPPVWSALHFHMRSNGHLLDRSQRFR